MYYVSHIYLHACMYRDMLVYIKISDIFHKYSSPPCDADAIDFVGFACQIYLLSYDINTIALKQTCVVLY